MKIEDKGFENMEWEWKLMEANNGIRPLTGAEKMEWKWK